MARKKRIPIDFETLGKVKMTDEEWDEVCKDIDM